MIETIRTYNSQFDFKPEIINEHLINKNYKHILLSGMGGSHLSAGILKTIQPDLDIYIHKDYDLPPFSKTFLESGLLIASSYSGNTEEVLSFYDKAKQLYDLPILCITCGGKLLDRAQKNNDPYIILPQTDFVPRTALGISTIALASVLKDKTIMHKLQNIRLDIDSLEQKAQHIVEHISNKIPLIYSSNQNMHLAYNWKIKMNETAKIMAFCNTIPESNHNELESYEFEKHLDMFVPIFLKDVSDDVRVQKRFSTFEDILKEQHINPVLIDISNTDIYQKIYTSIVLGDFVSLLLAYNSGVPQAEVPLIEKFKNKLI
jgi:glucose/mannose-6-phosphate isomerase